MSANLFTLTKNEHEIMEVLWATDRSLSRSEIIEFSPQKSWKASSIHILLNQLLEKGAIKVDGFVKTGRNYGRTYSCAVTQEEYQVIQFKQNADSLQSKSHAITNLVSALIDEDEIDDETLDRLDAILQARKQKKKKG